MEWQTNERRRKGGNSYCTYCIRGGSALVPPSFSHFPSCFFPFANLCFGFLTLFIVNQWSITPGMMKKWPMTPPTNDAETTKNIQKWSSEIQKFQGTSPFLTAPLAWQRAVARNFRRAVGSLARKRSCRRRNGCRACRTTSRRRVGDVRIGWNRTDGDIRKKSS